MRQCINGDALLQNGQGLDRASLQVQSCHDCKKRCRTKEGTPVLRSPFITDDVMTVNIESHTIAPDPLDPLDVVHGQTL